jgi:dihydroorotate dehydrogenase (NAD+) catalytic subunit
MDISTDLCGIKLENPTILASGILGVTKSSLKRVAEHGAAAVTMKSISKEPRKGHNCPIILTYEAGMMNAVGYSNPGMKEASREFTGLSDVGVPVFGSVIGTVPEDFVEVLDGLKKCDFSAIEVPLSCPHTPGFGTLAGQGTPEATFEITKAVKKATSLPVIIKLSPNIPNLGDVAKAAEKAGADAINAGNTLGPGMVINIESRKPILDFKVGGISGPALRPIAVRCVYDIYECIKIPIIGTGGVMSGRDAIEMIMAGATAVGIGTGVYYNGTEVFKKTCGEIKDFMEKEGYSRLNEMRGVAHEK